MRAALSLIVLFTAGLGGSPGTARAEGEAPSWIEAFSELRPGPLDLRDTRAPLEQRIALADALGEHGPAKPAIATLESALAADPLPPSRLREAIVRALARRLGAGASAAKALAGEPVVAVLSAAQRRAPPRPMRGPGAAWLARPRSGAPMVRAFLAETDARTLRAMARKLPELERLGPVRPDAAPALEQLCDRKAAPHALLMLAAGTGDTPPAETTRRALRAALAGAPCASDALSAPDDDPDVAPLRVLAALALAAIDDIEAVPSLRRALESPFARVRLAAATALAVLATPAACAVLGSHTRVENSALVRSALRCTVRDRD